MVDRFVKFLPGDLVERAHSKREIGVVDQHIDVAKLILGGLDHRIDLPALRDVGLKDDAAAARGFDLIEDFFRRLLIPVVIDDNRRAALS